MNSPAGGGAGSAIYENRECCAHVDETHMATQKRRRLRRWNLTAGVKLFFWQSS